MSIATLQRKVKSMLAGFQAQAYQEEEQEVFDRSGYWLVRSLELLSGTDTLPDDFDAMMQQLQQEQAEEYATLTPAQVAAEKRFQRKYGGEAELAKAELLQMLEGSIAEEAKATS